MQLLIELEMSPYVHVPRAGLVFDAKTLSTTPRKFQTRVAHGVFQKFSIKS